MEHAQRVSKVIYYAVKGMVLILILMEHAQRVQRGTCITATSVAS